MQPNRSIVPRQAVMTSSEALVEVDNFVRAEDEFTASNSGVQCRVSPAALIVTRGKATIINEPMLEYWSV
jgi:hypothetical protein